LSKTLGDPIELQAQLRTARTDSPVAEAPKQRRLLGNRLVSYGEAIFVDRGSCMVALWGQELDARPLLIDPTVPNIDCDAEPMSEVAGSGRQFFWGHHTHPLLIIFAILVDQRRLQRPLVG
jgi:hypothetical protein